MNPLSLVVCLFGSFTDIACAKEPEFPFPALDKDVIPYDSSTPFHKFDGIDYDELPKNFRDLHYTCQGEYVNCLRNSNSFHTICMYGSWLGYGNYYSLCELEIRNCLSRINAWQGLYGTYYGNDAALYQGDGYDCGRSRNTKESRRLAYMDVLLVPYRPFTLIYMKAIDHNSTTSHANDQEMTETPHANK